MNKKNLQVIFFVVCTALTVFYLLSALFRYMGERGYGIFTSGVENNPIMNKGFPLQVGFENAPGCENRKDDLIGICPQVDVPIWANAVNISINALLSTLLSLLVVNKLILRKK